MRRPSRIQTAAMGLIVGAIACGAVAVGAHSTGSVASVLLPINPCRLVDTRPAPLTVGTRSAPIGPGQTITFQVDGANGNCALPTTTTAIVANVTAVNPTASSFLTIYPADEAKPNASNLNWTPTSPPTPNQVTVRISNIGQIRVFNLQGYIDVIIDVVGYYDPAANAGPTGETGATGPTGATGGANVSATKVVGTDVTIPAAVGSGFANTGRATATATCPGGTIAVGGGYDGGDGAAASFSPTDTQWRADIINGSTGVVTGRAYAMCVPGSRTTVGP